MSDNFKDGIKCIVKPLRLRGKGWRELSTKSMGATYPTRAYQYHDLCVISAVEVPDENIGFEYHVSITKQSFDGVGRCSSNEAKWVLEEIGLEGWEEDNHVPYGKARHFWRPVAENLVGMECKCKAIEPAIVEDKGDFVWRPDSQS
jgi:hypothetical protein